MHFKQLYCNLQLTLIDMSSPPRDTKTLIGGRLLLLSWVSMVALIAFYNRFYYIIILCYIIYLHVFEYNVSESHSKVKAASYLEELKQHVIQMRGHIHDAYWVVFLLRCTGDEQIVFLKFIHFI